jgi:indolepyruvate ferredoxin oxidoreductase alpha subunit
MNRMVIRAPTCIISSGVAYQYAKEAYPEASFLNSHAYPFQAELVRAVVQGQELCVVDELDTSLRRWSGPWPSL